ncbi:MAG: hybrid sensor histidine kinase/response regulator [Gemmatimonadota bacterium]
MIEPVRPGRSSLRRRVLIGALITAALLVMSLGVLIELTSDMRGEVGAATNEYIEEQQIAGRLQRAVTRQLIAASFFGRSHREALIVEFRSAGDEAYQQIRQYLLLELTPEERLQLEAVKEQHAHLEVSAQEAFGLFARGHEDDARHAADAMVERSMTLQQALDGFLALRERDVISLRERQAYVFRYLYIAAAAFAVLLLGAVFLVTRFFNRRVGAPLAELVDAAGRIGRGDLDARVGIGQDDELATVAVSFNRMAARLAEGKVDLEQRNWQLREALETLRTMQTEIIQSEKLSAMGRMMAGLAHELNNPLASVLGYMELLSSHMDEHGQLDRDEIRRDYLQPVLAEALRARGLVRDFLQFSHQGAVGLTGIPLRDALYMVVRLRAYSFEQTGLTIVTEDDCAGQDMVLAQPQRLEQIFLNITNNAFDAMKARGHGSLRIRVGCDDDFITVTFEDDGAGFAQIDRVFEPFFSTKAVGAGTGLGLAIVHQYMEEFDGSVRAENRVEGGARVLLRLRRAPADFSPPAVEPDLPVSIPVNGGAQAAHNEQRRPRILVVEDEEPLRTLQKRFLTRLNAEVLLAADVAEAKRIVQETRLDLVISDVRMPGGKNGVDFYYWIEAEQPYLRDRFLFVTGDITDGEIAEFAERRPDRVVLKPFILKEYMALVRRTLATELTNQRID